MDRCLSGTRPGIRSGRSGWSTSWRRRAHIAAGAHLVVSVGMDESDPAAAVVTVSANDHIVRARLAGRSENEAAQQVLRLLGRPTANLELGEGPARPRFPGVETRLFQAPSRNHRFTGREAMLCDLRRRLRAEGPPSTEYGKVVAVQGLGGIGKTQIAIEYAHLYRAAYDVVWWVNSDPATFVDTSLLELGHLLGLPPQPTGEESIRAVLRALRRGEPHPRWLLIFDAAEEPEAIARFVPSGGHVLITSRDPSWSTSADLVQCDVFTRPGVSSILSGEREASAATRRIALPRRVVTCRSPWRRRARGWPRPVSRSRSTSAAWSMRTSTTAWRPCGSRP